MLSKNVPLQRSLCILRHLQRGPASRDEFALFVQIEADSTAYENFSRKADRKMWENDIARLRALGVELRAYPKTAAYRMRIDIE